MRRCCHPSLALQGPTGGTHNPCPPHSSPRPCNLPSPPWGCCTPRLICQGELTHRAGCQPCRGASSEAAGHTSCGQLWASPASEGSNNPLSPLSISVTPLIITPYLLLTWACPAASPRPLTQIHTTKTRSQCAAGTELPRPALGTRRSCWTSSGCHTVNPWPLFCRNKVNTFS